MPTIQLTSAELHYTEKGSGPTLVLLHGFPLDARMWDAQVESLAASNRVVAPDFRGFGRSAPAGPFTMESLADDVHELVTRLAATPIVLAGLSMGGYVALAYARKYGGTLRGLMLLDTKAEPDTPEGKEGRGKMIRLAREKGSAAVGEAMLPRLLPPDAALHKPAVLKRLREMMAANPVVTVEHALAAMRDRPDQTGMLASIEVPTLVLTGDADAITPPAVCEAMAKAIAKSQFVVIKGSGHMTTMEQPEQVDAAMARFLEAL